MIIDTLCRRYGCLPRELLGEDASILTIYTLATRSDG